MNTHLFLTPVEGLHTSKTFTGSYRNVKSYTAGTYFKWVHRDIDDVHQLSDTLTELESQNYLYINGMVRFHQNNKELINRRFKPKAYPYYNLLDVDYIKNRLRESVGHPNVPYDLKNKDKWIIEALHKYQHMDLSQLSPAEQKEFDNAFSWLLVDYDYPSLHHDRDTRVLAIDLDKVKADSLNHPVGTDAAVKEIIQKHLPDYFHDVTCHYQWSSSAGINNKANLHLWFMTRDYNSLSALRAYFKALKVQYPHVDDCTFLPGQPVFFTPPKFIDCVDPITKRSGKLMYSRDTVELVAETVKSNDWYTAQRSEFIDGERVSRTYSRDKVCTAQTFRFQEMVEWCFGKSITKIDGKSIFPVNRQSIVIVKATREQDYQSIKGQSKNRGKFLFKIAIELFKAGASVKQVYEFIDSLTKFDHTKDAVGITLGAAAEAQKEKDELDRRRALAQGVGLDAFTGGVK